MLSRELPFEGEFVELARSNSSEVFTNQNSNFVIKHKDIEYPQKNDVETKEAYLQRRTAYLLAYSEEKKREESKIREFLNSQIPEIKTPQTEFIIASDEDNLPILLAIQKKVEGKTLRDFTITNLSVEQINILIKLIDCAINFSQENGPSIELIGSSFGDSFKIKLMELVFCSIYYSSNIMISNDGEIFIVDMETSSRKALRKKIKNTRLKFDSILLNHLKFKNH